MDNEDEGVLDAEVQEQVAEKPDQRFLDQKKRAEKAEADARALQEQLEALKKQELPAKENPIQFDTLADNLSVLKPLEEDEIADLRKQAKELGVDPIKFAKSEAFKNHLEKLRVNKKAEEKTPESSHRTAVFEGKTYSEVAKDPNASPEAKQAAFIAQRDHILNRGRNQMI